MNRVLLRLFVCLFLVSVFLSGSLNFSFPDMQRASATEMFQDGNGNSSISQAGAALEENLSTTSLLSAESLSHVQKKLSSDLLRLSDERFLLQGETPETLRARMVKFGQLRQTSVSEPMVSSGAYAEKISPQAAEKVHVYIYLEPFANSSILDSYCEVTGRDEENHIAVAWVPPESLEILASMPEVKNIQTVVPPLIRQGGRVTERDSILNSSSLRELYGVNGTGIKIGVISDGVDNLAKVQASGGLSPDVHVLSNKVGGVEGTAMLEIIHKVTPGAELYFHDCGKTRLEFNSALDALVDEGCTIICDDIGWVSEPFFEDGIVASHVEKVIKDHDILYVSSAGNSGNSHYQGLFYDNGRGWHDFSEGQGKLKNLQLDIQPSGQVWLFLGWDDRWEHSENNYDLFLIDENSSEIIASSEIYQNGDDLPLEYIMYTNKGEKDLKASIQVRKTSGEARELELFIYYWPGVIVAPENLIAENSIFGHPALPEVVTVGAVDVNESENYRIENFSSLGPVTIAYPVREVRSKADLSGIDGVSITGSGDFPSQFYGTSASAPQVAAIAGLVWSAFPDKSGMDLKRLLCMSSIDLGDPGYDTVFGYGLVDALRMYEQAARDPLTFTVSENGSGDFFLLTDAINHSNPGDTILVYPGTYRENVNVPWALSIKAASGKPDDTIIEAASSDEPVFHVTGNSVNIRGLNIKGSAEASGIYLESAGNCTLENNKISGCSQGILLEGAFNNTLILNNISNNTEGLRLTASFLNRIEENEFDNNININETNINETNINETNINETNINETNINETNINKISEGELNLSNNWSTVTEIHYLYEGRVYGSLLGNFYSDYMGQDAEGNGIGDTPYGNDSFPLMARLAFYSRSSALGNAYPAENPVSIEGDILEFNILSTGNCTFNWLINGVSMQSNESVSSVGFTVNTSQLLDTVPESSSSSPFTVEYNLTVLAVNDSSTLQHIWNLTVLPTEEERGRIDRVIVSAPVSIEKDVYSSFNFTADKEIQSKLGEYSVYSVSFRSLEDLGNASARLELLNDVPSKAQGNPASGLVYGYLNLEFDNSSISNSENILNRTIKFRISRDRINENNVNISMLSLQRYSGGIWNSLNVSWLQSDEEYEYFEAETSGFSSFAITASLDASIENEKDIKVRRSFSAGRENDFETQDLVSFAVAEQKQKESLKFSNSRQGAENNSLEIGPDGAPEVWITRENENTSRGDENTSRGDENTSRGDENTSRGDENTSRRYIENTSRKGADMENKNIPGPDFGICAVLLLAGALWMKKK